MCMLYVCYVLYVCVHERVCVSRVVNMFWHTDNNSQHLSSAWRLAGLSLLAALVAAVAPAICSVPVEAGGLAFSRTGQPAARSRVKCSTVNGTQMTVKSPHSGTGVGEGGGGWAENTRKGLRLHLQVGDFN